MEEAIYPDIPLPIDYIITTDTETDSSSIPIYPQFTTFHQQILKTNNIAKYEELITAAQAIIANIPKTSPEYSQFTDYVVHIIKDVLMKYPYLSNVWKGFSLFMYGVYGLDSCLKTLSDGVDAFPHGIELWVDYLDALIASVNQTDAQQAASNDEGDKFDTKGKGYIIDQFELCLEYNGLNFMSHEIWEKYIEYVDDSEKKLEIYLRVIRVPLYQYANFFKQFLEINKSYPIEKIVDDLPSYLTKFGKSDKDELNESEKGQIIDDFSYKIFKNTQDAVTTRWRFESNIKNEQFHISTTLSEKEDQQDTENWEEYLKFSIDNFGNEAVINLFERCLVSQCLNTDFWIKYIQWSETHNQSQINSIYKKSVNKFVPIFDNKIRVLYALYLEKNKQFEELEEYYNIVIKLYEKIGNNNWYVIFAIKYLRYFMRHGDVIDYIVDSYFDKKNEFPEESQKMRTQVDAFIKLINDKLIGNIITVQLDKYKKIGNYSKVRDIFNTHYTKSQLQNSVNFWSFILKFELTMQNTKNINSIRSYILHNTTLPSQTINEFLTIINENTTKIDHDYIMSDNYKSISILLNKPMLARREIEGEKDMIKQVAKYVASPCNVRDAPILNGCGNIGGDGLPTFKNVEKSSLAVVYDN